MHFLFASGKFFEKHKITIIFSTTPDQSSSQLTATRIIPDL